MGAHHDWDVYPAFHNREPMQCSTYKLLSRFSTCALRKMKSNQPVDSAFSKYGHHEILLKVFTFVQKKLHEAVVESNQLKMDHASRLDLITRIDAEMKAVEAERVKNEAINKKYRANMTEYKVCTCTSWCTRALWEWATPDQAWSG